jgi:hypothetical protein
MEGSMSSSSHFLVSVGEIKRAGLCGRMCKKARFQAFY